MSFRGILILLNGRKAVPVGPLLSSIIAILAIIGAIFALTKGKAAFHKLKQALRQRMFDSVQLGLRFP